MELPDVDLPVHRVVTDDSMHTAMQTCQPHFRLIYFQPTTTTATSSRRGRRRPSASSRRPARAAAATASSSSSPTPTDTAATARACREDNTYEGWFKHSHNHAISMQPLGIGPAIIPHMKPLRALFKIYKVASFASRSAVRNLA